MSLVVVTDDIQAVTMGNHTTVTETDSVDTGLREVVYAMATLQTDPAADAAYATVAIPNQDTSPGVITVNTWQPTNQGSTIPIAATAFTKVVTWICFGK